MPSSTETSAPRQQHCARHAPEPQPFPAVGGRSLAGKLATELKEKNRGKENTARQLHEEFEGDAEGEAQAGL